MQNKIKTTKNKKMETARSVDDNEAKQASQETEHRR